MTSDHGEKRTVYNGKRDRSARLRRLRETKPYATKGSECDGLFAIPKWRMDEPMKDAKLKGAVGDMSSGINLKSLNPIECPDHFSSDLAQIKGKGEIGNEEAYEKLVGTLKSGSVSLIGRRRTMEDAVTEAPGVAAGKYSFFAAYDGHGGDMVANACSERLHKLLENELQGANSENPSAGVEAATSTGNVDWKKMIAACFSRMDDEVAKEEAVGSTAVVVIVGKEEVVVANCGDSRAVLCRGGVAIPLSFDHKPERTDERERVEAAGGRIIDWDGCRVQGVLSTSRSIGDHYLKPYVISEPEVTLTQRTESDEFLIIATDGLWDVVSNEFACEVVRRCLRRKSSTDLGATEAAAILAELAVAKGSRDNISVIVVQLKTKF